MESNYEKAVLEMLDEDATWPTLPDNISRKRGVPEAYFERFIRRYVREARLALDELDEALAQRDRVGDEVESYENLAQSIVGIQVGVRGRELLALAALADCPSPLDTAIH
jgi:hypothetical protein